MRQQKLVETSHIQTYEQILTMTLDFLPWSINTRLLCIRRIVLDPLMLYFIVFIISKLVLTGSYYWFQETVGIHMGTSCAYLFVHFSLYNSNQADFLQELFKKKIRSYSGPRFNFRFHYMDDLLSLNNSNKRSKQLTGGKLWMDNTETLQTLGTQDTRRRQTKAKTENRKQKTK